MDADMEQATDTDFAATATAAAGAAGATASRRLAAGSIDRPVVADVQRDTRPRHQPTAGVREDLR